MSDLPEYLDKGARLPRGGPDRVRLCFWYADVLLKIANSRELELAAKLTEKRSGSKS